MISLFIIMKTGTTVLLSGRPTTRLVDVCERDDFSSLFRIAYIHIPYISYRHIQLKLTNTVISNVTNLDIMKISISIMVVTKPSTFHNLSLLLLLVLQELVQQTTNTLFLLTSSLVDSSRYLRYTKLSLSLFSRDFLTLVVLQRVCVWVPLNISCPSIPHFGTTK
jgi:hypothetical protein